MNQNQRNINANAFIYNNFTYFPMIWRFSSQRKMTKTGNVRSVHSEFLQ